MLKPTGRQPWRQLWYQVRGHVRYQLESNLRAQLGNQLLRWARVQLWYQLRLLDQIQDPLKNQLAKDLRC